MKGARDPNRGTSKAISSLELDRRLFPVLFRLASSAEKVASQLFRPLVMQLIHWFTKNTKFENEETMALLETTTDAISNPSDGKLREFAAEALNEFVAWSLKQSKDKIMNFDSLLRRLLHLLHLVEKKKMSQRWRHPPLGW